MMEMRITIKVTGEKQDLAQLLSLINDLVVDHSETEVVSLVSEINHPIDTSWIGNLAMKLGADITAALEGEKDGGNE